MQMQVIWANAVFKCLAIERNYSTPLHVALQKLFQLWNEQVNNYYKANQHLIQPNLH